MVGTPPEPAFVEPFAPSLVTTSRESYAISALRSDIVAGLTVAIVAVPPSIAAAARVAPARSLYTAIIDSFPVSTLGGHRIPMGGPADAIIAAHSRGAEGARHGAAAPDAANMA
jgi:SulP family sulfate permease